MIADSTALDVGILFLRLVVGITMAAHGFQKFFGKGGIGQVAAWFDSIGMKPGRFNAIMAASTETAAGIALALGLFTPLAGAAYVALMVVAFWTVHRHGFFATKDGWEYNLVLGATAVTVATLGAGGSAWTTCSPAPGSQASSAAGRACSSRCSSESSAQ